MFLRNSWYVAAWTHELTDQLLPRTLLDERIVLNRTADGEVVAFEDRCPHRHLPLSMGRKCGDDIQCGYHGLTFDKAGACIAAPSQGAIPGKARLRAYPAQEKYGWIWLWMGEPEGADPALIPDFHQLTDPNFAAVGKTNHVRAAYKLVTDNLLDLSHVGYVHTSTIGNAEMGGKSLLKVERGEGKIRVVRYVENVPPPPAYIKTGVLPEGKNIDRWQYITFIPPCFVHIHVGGAETGTGVLEGRVEHGLNLWVINAMTPETAETTNYFWASVRAYALGNEAVDALFLGQVSEAFDEDKQVIEAQQENIRRQGDTWSVALKGDAGSIESRRLLDRLVAAEQGASQ